MNSISGTWYNQLGSKAEITANEDGSLSGHYYSAVGQAEYVYPLTGRYDTMPPSGKGTSIGWTVTWKNKRLNSHSTATWCGQYFVEESESPVILAQWFLARSTDSENAWLSTMIGHDEFSKTLPSDGTIDTAGRLNRGSNFPPFFKD